MQNNQELNIRHEEESTNSSRKHRFWSAQPMPGHDEVVPEHVNEPVEVKAASEYRQEPFSLPVPYFWDAIDIDDPGTRKELFNLLEENFVEEDDAMFRFHYSEEFLLWYWHRCLNPQKLVEVQFCSLGKFPSMKMKKKFYRLPEEPKTPGFRPMEPNDVPAVHQLLNSYLKRFMLAPEFSIEQVEHCFLPRPHIMQSYVVDQGYGNITDFVSFFSLPSTVVNHPVHKSIHAAYSFYNVANKTSWEDLMTDCLIMVQEGGYDVFNVLDVMDNTKFIPQLKFKVGDGNVNYYLFNWRCAIIEPGQIGLVTV